MRRSSSEEAFRVFKAALAEGGLDPNDAVIEYLEDGSYTLFRGQRTGGEG